MTELARRGYLGFGVSAEPDFSEPSRERWIVSDVDAGSPAALGGLCIGDDVRVLDGLAITSLADLRSRAAARAAGHGARLLILRGTEERELCLTALPMPLETFRAGTVELGESAWRLDGIEHRLRTIWTVPTKTPIGALWLLPSATWISQETPLTADDPAFHLVNQLTAAGIITFRADRSGLGDSDGPLCTELDFEAEMAMWRSARESFLGSPRVQGLKRLVYGRSLGGMLAPLVAAAQPFDGIVVWGTASEPWAEASRTSLGQQLAQKGAVGKTWELEMARIDRFFELIYSRGLSPAEAFSIAPDLVGIAGGEFHDNRIHDRVASFFQQLNSAQVADAWKRVQGRVLCIHAEYDILTSSPQLARIVDLVGPRASLLHLPGIDHFMHERASMEEAIQVPWGGIFSPRVTPAFLRFFEEVPEPAGFAG